MSWNGILTSLTLDPLLIFMEGQLNSPSRLFLLLVLWVAVSVFIWGYSYMDSKHNLLFFFLCLYVFVFSMMLLILSESFFLLFLGWEGLGVSSFALILFYQNWMSCKGAVLTLLTNRLGDSILLISFCYWLMSQLAKTPALSSLSLSVALVLVAATKSAQWPFISWLPAAMAAPTPVSALVHSSTLVTAGVWLLIRFSSAVFNTLSTWVMMGGATLLIASMAAMAETDGKKIVALSTLSQLGVMFMAMSMGNFFVCLFHVLMHALAKANLFMVVGELLHGSFTQQDTRHLIGLSSNKLIKLSLSVSILSLVGLVFVSGFFSKEQVLTSQYSGMTSALSWVFVGLFVGLTISYCSKLFLLTSVSSSHMSSISGKPSASALLPIFCLSLFSLVSGWVVSMNLSAYLLVLGSLYGWYWLIVAMGIFLFKLNQNTRAMSKGFDLTLAFLVTALVETLPSLKTNSNKVESSLIETLYMTLSLASGSLIKQSLRSIVLLSVFLLAMSVT